MTQPNQPDDELRTLLRDADPASGLAALEPDRITRMVNLTTSQTTSPTPRPAPARPLIWGLAGVGGVAAAAVIAWNALAPATTATLRLELPPDNSATVSCPMVEPALLKNYRLAFAARAEKVSDDLVTLQITEAFRGEPGTLVEVAGHDLSASDYSGFAFVEGQSYLISVLDPTLPSPAPEIALCGLSGPDDAGLRAVYEEAFG